MADGKAGFVCEPERRLICERKVPGLVSVEECRLRQPYAPDETGRNHCRSKQTSVLAESDFESVNSLLIGALRGIRCR